MGKISRKFGMALGTAIVAVITDVANSLVGVELLTPQTKVLVAGVIGLWIVGESAIDATAAYARLREAPRLLTVRDRVDEGDDSGA